MTLLELLAKQLDRDASIYEKQAPIDEFENHIDFWLLCLEAKRLLNEQKGMSNDKDK